MEKCKECEKLNKKEPGYIYTANVKRCQIHKLLKTKQERIEFNKEQNWRFVNEKILPNIAPIVAPNKTFALQTMSHQQIKKIEEEFGLNWLETQARMFNNLIDFIENGKTNWSNEKIAKEHGLLQYCTNCKKDTIHEFLDTKKSQDRICCSICKEYFVSGFLVDEE